MMSLKKKRIPIYDIIAKRGWWNWIAHLTNLTMHQTNIAQCTILNWNRIYEMDLLKLDENITLKSEKSVKAPGVILDNRLTFSGHISACCLKA